MMQDDPIDDLLHKLELGLPETIKKFNLILQKVTNEIISHVYLEEELNHQPPLDFQNPELNQTFEEQYDQSPDMKKYQRKRTMDTRTEEQRGSKRYKSKNSH